MRIENAIAVVTGASSGIGLATARRLGRDGASVVLVARGQARLEEAAHEIERAGGRAWPMAADAADGAAVLALAETVRTRVGVPSVIVNSAGAGVWRYIEETPPDAATAMMGAPYGAAFNVTHAFMADMLAAKQGVIVHVGSPFSMLPWPGAVAYGASRWALRGLHEALCQDLRGTGVHSCHVVFGKVSSAYFENNPGSEDHIPGVGKLIREVSPEECADVIAGVIRRPRAEVQHPPLLRAFYGAARVMPGTVKWLTALTGRKR